MTELDWQKSSYSGASSDCVEVRTFESLIELRESDEGEIVIRATARTFSGLLRRTRNGEFDHHADFDA
ncbi:DUF397 domain-containing protein [Kitasatospora sp. NPDC056327]|uniref:DUF397 domain-containing protein n=1 Tax=Kitasatospora sp. NPDC056327 TaxID=3345785 RepID=UPI0035E2CC8E